MPELAMLDGLMRRLYPVDRAAFVAHLLRLDGETRHERFGMAVSDAWIAAYARGCFGTRDLVYGFFVQGEIRAAGELRQLENRELSGQRAAEAAFSVEPGWRRKGLGTALMQRIVRAAQNRLDSTLLLMCLAQNRAMQGLARKFSADLTFDTDQVTGRMVGRHVSTLSLLGEALDDVSDIALAVMDARRRRRVPTVNDPM